MFSTEFHEAMKRVLNRGADASAEFATVRFRPSSLLTLTENEGEVTRDFASAAREMMLRGIGNEQTRFVADVHRLTSVLDRLYQTAREKQKIEQEIADSLALGIGESLPKASRVQTEAEQHADSFVELLLNISGIDEAQSGNAAELPDAAVPPAPVSPAAQTTHPTTSDAPPQSAPPQAAQAKQGGASPERRRNPWKKKVRR